MGAVNCFTDGSRFDNRSGYGYTIQGDGIKVNGYNSLGEYATVYQAELIAIQEAAFTMLGKEVRGKRITIYVDNQAAIQTLGSYQIRGRIAAETKRIVNKLSELNQVLITWILRSHG